VLITVNQWLCRRWDGNVHINLSSFDTGISLVNIVTQKMYSFESANRTKVIAICCQLFSEIDVKIA